ncbi:hypothetical protein U1769_06800 [Sphingomonas sp. ZT3P38]|uniref:hypothetical protein n=1 Tax=Parasphingomonas zepuensis TaxID=3096161 RepID=UPI002FCB7F16
MLVFVQLDISGADLALFEAYETAVLARHGAAVEERLRSADGRSEMNLLHFPDAEALAAFREDPARAALQDLWRRCGAISALTEVTRIA